MKLQNPTWCASCTNCGLCASIPSSRGGSFSCEVTSLLATSTLHQLGISTTCREDVAVQNSPCIALLSVRKSRCDHLPSAATVQQLAIVMQFCKIHNIQQFTTTSTSRANMLQMSILRCEIELLTLSLSSPAFTRFSSCSTCDVEQHNLGNIHKNAVLQMYNCT